MQFSEFSDDVPINMTELADHMRVSKATVSRWRAAGYQPLFGYRTTARHAKEWLSTTYSAALAEARSRKKAELEAQLAGLK